MGYGIEGIKLDGNNILEVYDTIKKLAESMRKKPRPVLIEAMTFRMRGHEEASGTKYVPQHLFDEWQMKDPLTNFEQFLLAEGILTPELREQITAEFTQHINADLKIGYSEPPAYLPIETELADVYAPYLPQITPPQNHRIIFYRVKSAGFVTLN